jgi:hypothetical protein
MGSAGDPERRIYFDTSSWNDLADHPARDNLIGSLKGTGTLVLASVFSVGEVLQTNNPARRRTLCETVHALHGEGPLLERPFDILYATASAFQRGDVEATVPESGPSRQLWQYMTGASEFTEQDGAGIKAWLRNSEGNLGRFIEHIKPPMPDLTTNYCSKEVLARDDFLSLLLQFPDISSLSLSVSDMRALSSKATVWSAAAATVAYMIELSTTHTPKSKGKKKRPGAADLWQAVYLGAVEIFVSSDQWFSGALAKISSCMQHPRCVVDTSDFLEGIAHWRPSHSKNISAARCWLCGCQDAAAKGTHALR